MKASDKADAIQLIVERTGHLQSSSTVAQKIVSLTRTADFNMQEVVNCLRHDPAMAAQILRLVNSSHYGMSHQVVSIKHAATIIGQRSLRMFAVTFALVDMLIEGAARELFDDYWQRALLIASGSSRIATLHDRKHFDDAYTAGLLADVGLLVLAQDTGMPYVELYKSCNHSDELTDAEEQVFGFTHAELGAQLLRYWEFPPGVIEAVLRHHTHTPDHSLVSAAVRAGNLAADLLDEPSEERLGTLSTFLAETFDATPESPGAFINACVADTKNAGAIFGYGTPVIPDGTLARLADLTATSATA
ncbi:MAG: HDOD domain-containing protein [Planctomycetaceae bacterium]|jgi:HD-like signal output (HDOD) protein|nr:HDOD domain-containing protein [Planctomycetaceae bacterium]MBT6157352.1 HDOD domain-containing protein [Planctomycetaceae bacterium]MBT6486760.1 HDOD domain-containing protein [Planctomycetaceae bacterium]MBT6493734.1 HDOD domain-containing protein [Planctomycetaceae bacterium]